ncbi:hypothetical protein [Aeromicrobium chenweiae]|uniref:hypothetical protein n=1 Tax=Aeromicrobium chenweiae TaxID=2079793 RepID=UPI0010927B62|nr:hypothetical protein [Aeromicrobium chenweiae]TGN33702.1 hypothetical protein E4L97_01185 [Aeromicrobium chenweiae]
MISTSRKARAAALVLLAPTAIAQSVLFAPGAARAHAVVAPKPVPAQETPAPAPRSLAVPMPEVGTPEALPIPQFRPGSPWQDELTPQDTPRAGPPPRTSEPWRISCTACARTHPTILP